MIRNRFSKTLAGLSPIVAAIFAMHFSPPSTAAAARIDPTESMASGVAEDTVVISGQVVDAATGLPLPGAQIRIVELNRAEIAHANGEFYFARLASGKYTLVFERMGYRRATRTVEMGTNDSTHLRVALEFSALELPGLTVTGVAGQRTADDLVRATTVLGGQELARKLDATIASTLDGQPGVTMSSMGPATARPVIRGLAGDRILILEDGERVGDLSASSPDHAVSVEAVTAKQIEVVRGPATLLYGSNALGGVVNVIRDEIPTSLTDHLHGSLSLQGQSVNRGASGGGYVIGSTGPIALRLEGSVRHSGDIHTPAGVLENTDAQTYNLSAGGSWIGERGYAGLAYRFYDSAYGVPGHDHHHDGHDDDDHDDDHGDVSVEMRRHTIRGGMLRRPTGGLFTSIEVDGSFTNYNHKELEGDGEIGTEFDLLSGTGSLLARHGELGFFSSGAFGLQAQWRDLEVGGDLVAPPSSEYALAGFVLQEVDLHPFRLELGGRYDWRRITPRETEIEVDIGDVRTRTFGSISASAGALYDFGGGVGLGASVARSFRTPDVTELYSQGPHLAVYSVEIGNPELGAETGLGTDLFLRVTRDRVKGELAAFRNDISHYIFPRRTDDVDGATGLPIYKYVGENAVLTGLEGRTEWSVADRLVLDGTASYVRGVLKGSENEPLPFIPPLSGRLGARYETPGYFLDGGVKLAARQDRLGEFEDATAGYTVFDASIGYRWIAHARSHTITLRADNITDAEYRDHLSRIKEIMPQPGRSISLLYRVNF